MHEKNKCAFSCFSSSYLAQNAKLTQDGTASVHEHSQYQRLVLFSYSVQNIKRTREDSSLRLGEMQPLRCEAKLKFIGPQRQSKHEQLCEPVVYDWIPWISTVCTGRFPTNNEQPENRGRQVPPEWKKVCYCLLFNCWVKGENVDNTVHWNKLPNEAKVCCKSVNFQNKLNGKITDNLDNQPT